MLSLSRLIILFVVIVNCFAQKGIDSDLNKKIKEIINTVPFEFPEVKVPEFSVKEYRISDFGAVPDGITLNTEVFKNVIEQCSKNGGGTIIVPRGIWLTGPIELKSNINLHLLKGSIILFTPDRTLYPMTKAPGSSTPVCTWPVWGIKVRNVAITGEGILDGNGQNWRPVKKEKMTEAQWKTLISSGGALSADGKVWWPSKKAAEAEDYMKTRSFKNITQEEFENIRDYQRPNMVVFFDSENLLFDGITIQNSPRFGLYPQGCRNVIINKVKIYNQWWSQNGDGIDIGSCKNVVVNNCIVDAGDDGICMKSSPLKYMSEPYLENVIVTNSTVYHGHGGFVIGSNTDGGIKNIYVKNCNFIWTDIGLRFKSGIGKGNTVENIVIEDIFMKDIKNEAISFDMFYEDKGAVVTADKKKNEDKIPQFNGFKMNNIVCIGAKTAVYVNAIAGYPLKNVELSNSVFETKSGVDIKNVENFSLKNIKIHTSKFPVFTLSESKDILLDKISALPGKDFMTISGTAVKDVIIKNTGIVENNYKISFIKGADSSAVKIE